jgi:PAS domain S-box-containing protein
MAELVRSHNWADTPLGPIDTWSETLLTSVNIMLNSAFPMAVCWGAEMIEFYNDAYLSVIGEKHPYALGAPAREVWKEAWHVIGPRFEDAMTRGQGSSQENALVPVTRGGRIEDVFWTYSTSPIHDASGAIAGLLTVCLDVTGEVLARRDRRLLSEQLNHVLDSTTDGVASLDRGYRFVYLNRRAREMMAPGGPLLGRSIWECFPRMVYEDSPFVENCRRAMEEGVNAEFDGYYPEPLNVWLHVNVRPAKDGIAIFFRDKTAQMKIESDARESAARLNAIYNTSLEYIGLLSIDGRVLDCNHASLEFAHNTREQVVGLYFWDCPWFQYTSGAAERLRRSIARAARGEYVRYEVELSRPSGEPMTFDFSLAPVRDSGGKVIFIVPEGRDITWMKRAESALKESEKLASVGRLAASIAHEINNPLEAVTNLLYLAMRSANSDELREYLEIAEREVRHVSTISSQTLQFYRQVGTPRAICCDELFESALFIHHGRIVKRRVEVERRLQARHSLTCFDGEIRQVLNNLIGNAIDAMPAGGGRLMVRSREATNWATGERGVVLTVADNGSGIRADHRAKIFDPFFTTKGTGGTGLGLWVSNEIVKRHHGSLRMRSTHKRSRNGTVFTVFLPYEAAIRQSAA